MVQLLWRSEDDLAPFAQWLANRNAIGSAFIALDGDLGAGKTTLVRKLLQHFGVHGHIKSPTYAIMESYEIPSKLAAPNQPLIVSHFDFYRFQDEQEWEDAGFRDVFGAPGLKVVEWPDKALGLLPLPDLLIKIEAQSDESRTVTLKAFTSLGLELLP
jgi:tRNA threonylcarbamoyladenosine biosynthesis protein TsaE